MIYLDNAASTRIDERVDGVMRIVSEYANPSSIHSEGTAARKLIDRARRNVADMLHCDPSHIIFTSGGSESNAMVLRGFKPLYNSRKNRVAYSAVEHESVVENATRFPAGAYAKPFEIMVNSDGCLRYDDLENALADPTVRLVSVMAMNNEIPSRNLVREIADRCHVKGVAFHTDCVQAVGSMELDVNMLGCDFMSLSAHKFHGPKGVGILYCRYRDSLYPLVSGSGSQEFGLKSGTENIVGIVGAGKAAELAVREFEANNAKIAAVKSVFYSSLRTSLNERKAANIMRLNGNPAMNHKVLSITFDGVDAQTLVLALSSVGIYISAGSACNANSTVGSKVLKAIGLTDKQAHQTVRFSFSKFNTEDEMRRAATIVANTVLMLREMGGVGNG